MGGMTYTMTDTPKLSTAECYGIALCELGEEHKDVVALTADLAKSTKIGMFGEKFPERSDCALPSLPAAASGNLPGRSWPPG